MEFSMIIHNGKGLNAYGPALWYFASSIYVMSLHLYWLGLENNVYCWVWTFDLYGFKGTFTNISMWGFN